MQPIRKKKLTIFLRWDKKLVTFEEKLSPVLNTELSLFYDLLITTDVNVKCCFGTQKPLYMLPMCYMH